MIHHLIIRPRSAITACGLLVDVYMPGSGTAIGFKPIEQTFQCTTDEAQASCLQCHTKAPRARDTLHRDVPVNPREPKRFERVDRIAIKTGSGDEELVVFMKPGDKHRRVAGDGDEELG